MAIKRKKYLKEFKIDTVKLIIEQGFAISEAVRNQKEIERDFMQDYVKVKDTPEWQAFIKKWITSN